MGLGRGAINQMIKRIYKQNLLDHDPGAGDEFAPDVVMVFMDESGDRYYIRMNRDGGPGIEIRKTSETISDQIAINPRMSNVIEIV